MVSAVRLASAFALLTISLAGPGWAQTVPFSPLQLTGADKIHATGNLGQGVYIGDIDTGAIINWTGFRPGTAYNTQTFSSIDQANSAVCLNGARCGSGVSLAPIGNPVTDGDGHGTFTMSQIVGYVHNNANSNSYGYQSYLPAGIGISVQVMGSDGSGGVNDLINGIGYAASKGVMVENLSLAPSKTSGSTSSQQQSQASFYTSIAPVVNAAAAKGVYFVFAAGNNTQQFADGAKNITGFTSVALEHMLIMGSVNAKLNLSYFSDTPGSASFKSTSGLVVPVSAMTLFSDGENVFGASNYSSTTYGYNYMTQDTGTSMSAPQGTGAIGLLIRQWPLLAIQGTAAQILLESGRSLGDAKTYGKGLMDLLTAFKPLGTLTVTGENGTSITANSSGVVQTTGALGTIAGVQAILVKYTAFDGFHRDFIVNLASSMNNKPSTTPAVVTATAPPLTTSGGSFADGSSLAFGSIDTKTFLLNSSETPPDKHWFMSFTDAAGTTMASGSGFPASSSFANALWGTDRAAAGASSQLGVSNTLLDLAEGGTFMAVGSQLSNDTRMAFSWTETAAPNANGTLLNQPNANAFSTGITTKITDDWKAGLTLGLLNEQNGLLGTTYISNSMLGFGDQNQSMSMGVSSAVALTNSLELLVDAAVVRTDGNGLTSGIISDISPLYARTLGAALVNHDTFAPADNLSISVRAPLRVFSGSVDVATTSVAASGVPTTANQRVSLTPNGTEVDFSVGYDAPITSGMSWNLMIDARHDAGNVAGANDADFLVGTKLNF